VLAGLQPAPGANGADVSGRDAGDLNFKQMLCADSNSLSLNAAVR
jgi:hypothetical protein